MKGGGFGLLLLLLAALLAAYLFVSGMGSMGVSQQTAPEQQTAVKQTKETVDELNKLVEDRYKDIDLG